MEAISWVTYLGGIGLVVLLVLIALVDWVANERWRTPPAWTSGKDERGLHDLDPG